jgi:hypothetical protein
MRAFIVSLLPWASAAFRQYPLFKQCDPNWGNNTMGTPGPGERSNICGEGCAMSSVSMALAGLKFQINGVNSDPASLNAWLIANAGYVCAAGDCNNLVLDAPTWLDKQVCMITNAFVKQAALKRNSTSLIACSSL